MRPVFKNFCVIRAVGTAVLSRTSYILNIYKINKFAARCFGTILLCLAKVVHPERNIGIGGEDIVGAETKLNSLCLSTRVLSQGIFPICHKQFTRCFSDSVSIKSRIIHSFLVEIEEFGAQLQIPAYLICQFPLVTAELIRNSRQTAGIIIRPHRGDEPECTRANGHIGIHDAQRITESS